MLHAAAMWAGLAIIWLAATQGWSSVEGVVMAASAALACVVVALRFRALSPDYAGAPASAWLSLSAIGAVVGGLAAVARAALSADVTLRPALVRIRTRAATPQARVAFANLLSAAPGVAVVETDEDGFLVHVAFEDGVDAAELGRVEEAVRGALEPERVR